MILSQERLQLLVDNIIQLIDNSSLDVEKYIQEFFENIDNIKYQSEILIIKDSLSEFDYDIALEPFIQIVNDLGLNTED